MPPSHGLPASLLAASSNGALTPGGAAGLSGTQSSLLGGMSYDANANANPSSYDFFDPQHWMLDNLLDFSYPYVPPLEGA